MHESHRYLICIPVHLATKHVYEYLLLKRTYDIKK